MESFGFDGIENAKPSPRLEHVTVLRRQPHRVRSKTRCNGRRLLTARRAKPQTIRGVKYSSGESGGSLRKASDKEVPPATLTCEITSVERESSESVSEGFQSDREVESIW